MTEIHTKCVSALNDSVNVVVYFRTFLFVYHFFRISNRFRSINLNGLFAFCLCSRSSIKVELRDPTNRRRIFVQTIVSDCKFIAEFMRVRIFNLILLSLQQQQQQPNLVFVYNRWMQFQMQRHHHIRQVLPASMRVDLMSHRLR